MSMYPYKSVKMYNPDDMTVKNRLFELELEHWCGDKLLEFKEQDDGMIFNPNLNNLGGDFTNFMMDMIDYKLIEEVIIDDEN